MSSRVRAVMLLSALLLAGCGNQRAATAQGDGRDAASLEDRASSAQAVLELARSIARADPALAKRLAPTALGWTAHKDGIVSPGWERRPGKTTAELAALAPERADGTWELSLDRTERYRLAMQWEDAASVIAERADGAVVYRNVHEQTDAIVTSTTSYVEVSYVLYDASAPRKWRWSVEQGAGIAAARRAPDGGLYLVRKDGGAVWSVPVAYAVDAAGKRIAVRSEWLDGGLAFEMEGEASAYPVIVDPIVTAQFWVLRTSATSPPARAEHAMVYDSQRGKTVLFGGLGGGENRGDTWEWDGVDWVQRTPTTSPPARREYAMAYDSQRGRVVLFGGCCATGTADSMADTWEWDGTSWTQRTPATSPPARRAHAMAYDSRRGRTVLAGGSTNPGANSGLNDTWEWDGTNWSMRSTIPTRLYHAMAYDSQRGRVILFGGSTFTDGGASEGLSETWEWNGIDWVQRTPTTSPPARAEHAMVYDSRRDKTLVYGGQHLTETNTWEWDGTEWAGLSATGPGRRSGHDMAYDSQRGATVLFSGDSGASAQADTWELITLRALGSDCNGAAQCGSGFCSDGVCCDALCDGACNSCKASLGATEDGTCTALPLGSPRCTHPFQCNGVSGTCPTNGCAFHNDCVPTHFCSQVRRGECQPKVPEGAPCPEDAPSCVTGYCMNGTCSACSTDAQCSMGNYCSPSKRVCSPRLSTGTPCPDGDPSCVSGLCAHGVCCDARCNGDCEACTASLKGSGADGVCEPVAAGTDPHDRCPTDPDYPRSCRADGTCNGSGACRQYAVEGTECDPPSCESDQLTLAECNGAGSCLAKSAPCAGNRACVSTSACGVSCRADRECAAGFACAPDGSCAPSGSTCRDDRTVLDSRNVPSSCAPYRCSGGACKTTCASVDDCVESAVCDDTRHCVAPASANGGEDGCACRTGSTSRRSPAGACALGILAILAGVRQKRRSRRSPETPPSLKVQVR